MPPGAPRPRLLEQPTTTALLIALTFATGIADAVGYLELDKVFTGNMTGNVVILGMGAAGAEDLPVAGPVCALLGFMAGAAAGGRSLRTAAPGWTPRVTGVVAVVAGVLALAAGYAALRDLTAVTEQERIAVATAVATVMGVQAAAARHVGVKDVTTVVVTSTITGLAADSRLGAGREHPWVRRAAAISAIGCGALAGALLSMVHLGVGLAAAAVVTGGVAVVAGVLTRRGGERRITAGPLPTPGGSA